MRHRYIVRITIMQEKKQQTNFPHHIQWSREPDSSPPPFYKYRVRVVKVVIHVHTIIQFIQSLLLQ